MNTRPLTLSTTLTVHNSAWVFNTIITIAECKLVSYSHHLSDKYSFIHWDSQIYVVFCFFSSIKPNGLNDGEACSISPHYERARCTTLTKGGKHLKWLSSSPNTASTTAHIITMSWCDTAPRLEDAAPLLRCSWALKCHFLTCKHVKKQRLPFLGLWWVFSERCWPPSQQSAPSPNSAQPSCSVEQSLDARREGNANMNDRTDRYDHCWGRFINVRRNERDTCSCVTLRRIYGMMDVQKAKLYSLMLSCRVRVRAIGGGCCERCS